MQLTMLTGKLLVPATGRCTPETWHCWLGRRLMIDGSNRPTMQAGVSRTAGGCERCKDEWKQESYGPRLRHSCWSFGLCVSLTWATMIQLWSLVSGFAMRIVKPSGVLNCNQFGAKLLSKDAIDRLWSFVFLPCIYIILFLSYLFYYIIYDILCYVRLYAVYTVCPGLVSCPFIDNDLKVC